MMDVKKKYKNPDFETVTQWDTLWEEEKVHSTPKEVKEKKWETVSQKLYPQKKSKKIWLLPLTAAAAVILIFMVLLPQFQNTTSNTSQDNVIISSTHDMKKVSLPDNSIVILSPNTTISYAKDFDERKVTIHGKAYFNITKNKDNPFEITSGKWTTTVLGTSFSHSLDSISETLNIQLFEGKLRTSDGQKAYIIDAGTLFNSDTNTKLTALFENNSKTIHFQNEDLTTILGYLQSTYNVNFNFNSIPNKKITLTCTKDEKLEDILNTLHELTDWKYSKQGKEVIIEL